MARNGRRVPLPADQGSKLSLDGPGTLILSGSNGYTSGTSVNAGTLILAANNAIADGTSMSVGSGGTLIFDVAAAAAPIAAEGASVSAVPEPGTLALLAAALGGAVAYRSVRSRRKKQ